MVIVVILIALIIMTLLWYAGVLSFEDIYANFFFVLFQLVTITILAILGAVFFGMLLSHRILQSRSDFTPIELATMETNTMIKEMKEKIERLEKEVEETKLLVEQLNRK